MLVHIDRPNLALLRGADYPGIVLMALFFRLSAIHAGRGPALGPVRRRHDPYHCMDLRHCRRSPLSGTAWPMLNALSICVRSNAEIFRSVASSPSSPVSGSWTDLSDAAVSRPSARLQRAGDRLRRILDRRFPGSRHSGLNLLHPVRRSALADDGRPGLLRIGHVEFYADYPRLGLARAAAAAGLPRLCPAVRRGADSNVDIGRLGSGATETGVRFVQIDTQLGRCDWHCLLCHNP